MCLLAAGTHEWTGCAVFSSENFAKRKTLAKATQNITICDIHACF